jgi:hypothetical protein
MADLRCCDFRWYSRDAEQFPLDSIIRRIGQDGIAKGNDKFLNLRSTSLRGSGATCATTRLKRQALLADAMSMMLTRFGIVSV